MCLLVYMRVYLSLSLSLSLTLSLHTGFSTAENQSHSKGALGYALLHERGQLCHLPCRLLKVRLLCADKLQEPRRILLLQEAQRHKHHHACRG